MADNSLIYKPFQFKSCFSATFVAQQEARKETQRNRIGSRTKGPRTPNPNLRSSQLQTCLEAEFTVGEFGWE
jgi:hypothetical protein